MIDQKHALYEALRMLVMRGDVIQDTRVNVSVFVRDDGGSLENKSDKQALEGVSMFIKPSGVPYTKISLKDLDITRVNGNGVETKMLLRPSVDSKHHAAIYRNNSTVTAICHTHSPYAVAFAIREEAIECVCTEHAEYFGRTIRCLPYADLDSWGSKVVLERGERAVLLGKHGALTFSDDPVQAVNLAVQLENVARKTYLARTLGLSKICAFDDAEKWHRLYNTSYGQR